jgi:hypothetical protein
VKRREHLEGLSIGWKIITIIKEIGYEGGDKNYLAVGTSGE